MGQGTRSRCSVARRYAELSERILGSRLSDPSARAELLDAVGRCRDRLVGEGVDLSAYTLEQSAADIEDLRRTLGIPSWNIISWGSDSRVIFELLREFPEGVRSVILHGPQLPQLDPVTEAAGETRGAIAEIAAVCAADERCGRSYPDVEEALSDVLQRLELDPIEVEVDDSRTAVVAGHPIRVMVDGSAFLRAIRNLISDADLRRFAEVPAIVYAALDGDVSSVATVLSEDVDTCVGYLSSCTIYRLSHGAFYSAFCRDMAGSVDRSKLTASIDGEAAWASAYGEHPYLEICAVWDVGSGDPTTAEPVTSDVPILIFRGQFDAFSDRAEIDRSMRTLSAAQVIHVDNDVHDITRELECYRAVRRAWLDEPTSHVDPGCLRGVPPPEFVVRP